MVDKIMDKASDSHIVGSKNFTAVAINTASKAGAWIRSKLGDTLHIHQKYSMHDLVTEIDKGSEMMIRNLILTHFPTHAFLGEEGVQPGPAASTQAIEEARDAEYLWIVDPIDGTTNYIHGFPFFCVSIALAFRGEIIVGVIYDPAKDELFVAEKGKGAYLSGKQIKVSTDEQLSNSLVATGLPADHEYSLPLNLKGFQAVAPKVRNIRIAGSAALHMAYVAAGRLSGFWELGLNVWDVAAGVLLIQESGGEVTDTSGNAYHLGVRHILATNGKIHQQLREQLQLAEATG
jgi:myo-inositol-1(or 4)-monophosphatase